MPDLGKELQNREYKASPVRRVLISKPDGTKRPLGIPTIRDRVVQMATKIVIEPIFEADFVDHSYMGSTKFLKRQAGRKRMLLSEGHRKAVCGRTACTV